MHASAGFSLTATLTVATGCPLSDSSWSEEKSGGSSVALVQVQLGLVVDVLDGSHPELGLRKALLQRCQRVHRVVGQGNLRLLRAGAARRIFIRLPSVS
jgi:hypothetical protein